MIPIPDGVSGDRPFIAADVDRLADWVELWCLVEEDSEVSESDIADTLNSSGLYGEESREEQDLDLVVENIMSRLRLRQRRLGDAYPFKADDDMIVGLASLDERLCFTALLVADMLRFYRHGLDQKSYKGVRFTYLFEKVAEACISTLCQAPSVRFGWPRDIHLGWPTSIQDRINFMADLLNVEATEKSRYQSWDKDIGLDIVARWTMGDPNAGQLYLLVQCATGDNWKGKTGEPSLKTWENLVDWRGRTARAVAFPWRVDVDDRRLARISDDFEAIVLDRYRLLSGGNPDKNLDRECRNGLQLWCENGLKRLQLA